MILADTSIWIDHLRKGDDLLRQHLDQALITCHPFVIGELACGRLNRRAEFLGLLQALPQHDIAEEHEVLHLVEHHRLTGQGLGWIDIHLLTSCKLAKIPLWTRDKSLAQAAESLGVKAL